MSQFSGLSVMNVKRVVRHAILNHRFFHEEKPGIITHSAPSAVLAGDDLARNAIIVQLEEFCPAGIKVNKSIQYVAAHKLKEQAADALEKWPNSEENNQTACINTSENSTYADMSRAFRWSITPTRACLTSSLKTPPVVPDLACCFLVKMNLPQCSSTTTHGTMSKRLLMSVDHTVASQLNWQINFLKSSA
jgi:hypothetical protein